MACMKHTDIDRQRKAGETGGATVQVAGVGVAVAAAQERILYEIQAQAARPAGQATCRETRSCPRPLAALLSAINEPAVAAHTKTYRCSDSRPAAAFLQGLAFLQQTDGQTPPVAAVAAVLRGDSGWSPRAGQGGDLGGAALWGLLRTAALEHPTMRWTALQVDSASAPATSDQVRTSFFGQCLSHAACAVIGLTVV